MNQGKAVRTAIVLVLALAVIALLVLLGAPMIGMLRAHLGM